eukprot:Skav219237  [mRNA]  locus=scaffold1242:29107:30660:+ [translate_table: standard]
MAGGIGLVAGPKLSDRVWNHEFDPKARYVLFEALDDDGLPQGLALGEIMKRYRGDQDGAFCQIRYLQAQDAYYRHWATTQAGDYKYHHFCRLPLKTCERKVGKKEVVHIQRFAMVNEEEVARILAEWKLKPLMAPKDTYKGKPLEEEKPPGLSAKAKPKKGEKEQEEPDAYGLNTPDFDSSEEVGVPVDAGRGRPVDGAGTKHRGGGDRGSPRRRPESREKAKDRTHKVEAAGSTDKRKAPRGGTSALDAVLDDDAGVLAPSPRDMEIDTDALRRKLGEVKSKAAKANASAVLASRIKEEASSSDRSKKRRSEDTVVDLMRALTSSKRRRRDESRSSDDESRAEDDLIGGGARGDLAAKQRRLKKLAEEKPGALLTRGYALIHDQLGTLFGSGAGSSRDASTVLQPGALRYLLTCALPMVNAKMIGEERLRELRTLATALDLVVTGKATEASDYLMQRYKSVLMAIRDGTNVASKFLELIPQEAYPTGTTDGEVLYARETAYKTAKSEELMSRMTSG